MRIQDFYKIFEAKEGDGGIYRCVAKNEVGEGLPVETHVIVAGILLRRKECQTVIDPPTFAQKPPSEIRVKEGLPLDIPCEGFGDPVPIVYWMHNQVSSLIV